MSVTASWYAGSQASWPAPAGRRQPAARLGDRSLRAARQRGELDGAHAGRRRRAAELPATDRHRHAARRPLPRPQDGSDHFPAERRDVVLALAGDDQVRARQCTAAGRRWRRSRPRQAAAERPRRPRARSRSRPPRPAPGAAGSPPSSAGQPGQAGLEQATSAGLAPFCGPNTAAAPLGPEQRRPDVGQAADPAGRRRPQPGQVDRGEPTERAAATRQLRARRRREISPRARPAHRCRRQCTPSRRARSRSGGPPRPAHARSARRRRSYAHPGG